jgi:hypothetical protein
VDESLEECLAWPDGSVGEALLDPMPHGGQFVNVGCLSPFLLDGCEEILAAGPQVSDLGSKALDALPALGIAEGARLEGGEVALDGIFGLGDPGVDDSELVVVVGPLSSHSLPGCGDSLVEEVGALVGAQQRFDDGVVELFGG